jgi:hypothetical protein
MSAVSRDKGRFTKSVGVNTGTLAQHGDRLGGQAG